MKTLILSLSPRKNFSASMYYSKVLKFLMKRGDVSILELKTQKQLLDVEKQLQDIDHLVFATPVYIDSTPSTALEHLSWHFRH